MWLAVLSDARRSVCTCLLGPRENKAARCQPRVTNCDRDSDLAASAQLASSKALGRRPALRKTAQTRP